MPEEVIDGWMTGKDGWKTRGMKGGREQLDYLKSEYCPVLKQWKHLSFRVFVSSLAVTI